MGLTNLLRSLLSRGGVAVLACTLLTPVSSASAHPASVAAVPAVDRTTGSEGDVGCNWRRKRCYGAISLNTRTGQTGFANDKRTAAWAQRIALRKCRRRSEATTGFPGQCKPAYVVRNKCLAVAIRVNDDVIVEWAPGRHYDQATAITNALAKVRGRGDEYVQRVVCTTRTR